MGKINGLIKIIDLFNSIRLLKLQNMK